MKRSFFAVLLILTLLLFGCGAKESKINYLNYQSYPFQAHGILNYDGHGYEIKIKVSSPEHSEIQILSHPYLQGTVLRLDGDRLEISLDGITEQIDDGGYSTEHGIALCGRMFSIPKKSLIDSGLVSENGIKYSFGKYRIEGGEVTVLIQEGMSFPDIIKASINGHQFSFTFINEN